MTMSAWLFLSPLVAVLVGGLILMVVDATIRERPGLSSFAWLTFLIAGGAATTLFFSDTPPDMPTMITDYIAVDKMSLFFDILICGAGFLTTLLADGYLQEHRLESGEFYVLLLFCAFGAMVLAAASDLLSMFLGLETMSLAAYALVGFRRTSARAAEGAVKYFLLGSFAAAVFLFGCALLYGATNHTDLQGIGETIATGGADSRLTLLAMALMIAGMAFKVSAVPFHMWTPDAYEGAVTPATTFMSVAVKAAGFAMLLRVLLVAFGDELSIHGDTGWPPVIAALAALSMVVGNIAAVAQTSVKRMLAYSSIAHAGYLLVGLAAAFRVPEGVSSVLYYLLAYTVSNVLAFGALILIGSKDREAVSYEDLAGVGRRHPLVAFPFVLGILSLMGFPPTAGFFGKYYVFQAAVLAGPDLLWLAILGVVTSAIGAYYYLKVIVFLFMTEPQAGATPAIPMRSISVATALVLSGYFVVKMGITPGRYLDMAIEAAHQLVV